MVKPQRKLQSILHLNRLFMTQFVKPGDIAIDATLGKGNDTLTLLDLVGETGHVHSFDIQAEAIAMSQDRLDKANVSTKNYTLHHRSHSDIAQCVQGPIQFAIFNLGYLPTGDKLVTTLVTSTQKGIVAAFSRLEVGGTILITVYPGHPEGKREADFLEEWLRTIPQEVAEVLHYEFTNHINAPPHTYIIERRKEGDI